jgi:DNA-binding NarL/FixJ family response regulator
MREVIGALLSDVAGVSVVGMAVDGDEAVRLALELKPTLVVMDVAMPKLSGIEATRQILESLPRTAIVAVSNHDDRRLVAAMLKAGALAYVLKGDALDSLGPAVRAALRGKLYADRKRPL